MIFLAPLQGYTDFIFRNVYGRHYTGIDIAVSPFIPLSQGKNLILRIAKDVLPANNQIMPVIPQLLGNRPEHFISMAHILHSWGYEHLNWNIGCPVKNTTRKKRGSGILPYPDLINEILEKVIPNIPQQLSVKLRLGLKNTDEIYQVIPVLNNFPLENIIIHPRIGTQMYESTIHHDELIKCLPLIKHEIVYNGDIVTFGDYQAVRTKYPSIQKWMIGRGIFYNPLLPAIIKGEPLQDEAQNTECFFNFILDLYCELQKYRAEEQVVNKIKDWWKLFSKRFVNSEIVFNQISHAYSIEEIIRITQKLAVSEKMKDWNG